ncbi:MAG: hypothetical protein K6343_00765 [Caldisericaceae bacterium]
MKKVNTKIWGLAILLVFAIVVVSMVGCSKPNLPGGSSGLPVYPNSQESSDFNMWATATGFSNQFTEFHSYVVSGVSPNEIVKWYKSKLSNYTVENEINSTVQGTSISSLTLKKDNTLVGVMAFEQKGKTVYFVGETVSQQGDAGGTSLPQNDTASGEEPIERYPGSVMLNYYKRGDFPILYDIDYGTKDTFDKVADWFERTLQSKGWSIDSQNSSTSDIDIDFSKADDEVDVWVGAPTSDTPYTQIHIAYTKHSLPDHDLTTGEDPIERYPKSVMIEYNKSTMTMPGANSTEIKAVYLAPDTFDKVKKWYLDLLNKNYSMVYDQGESIDAGSKLDNKAITVHIDFEKHNTYTEISVDYTVVEQ